MKKNSQRFKTRAERPDRNPAAGRVVLGVDPGTLATGYGIISARPAGISLVACGAIRNRPESSVSDRLKNIHEAMVTLAQRFHPSEFAIESAFYGKNAQSALKLGQARGVLILAAAVQGIPVFEYSPREIKKSVTGNGNATKHQIHYMVRSLLDLPEQVMTYDTSDALAAALCHIGRRAEQPKGGANDWSAFIAAHPERVIR